MFSLSEEPPQCHDYLPDDLLPSVDVITALKKEFKNTVGQQVMNFHSYAGACEKNECITEFMDDFHCERKQIIKHIP